MPFPSKLRLSLMALPLSLSGCVGLPEGHLVPLRAGRAIQGLTRALDPRPLVASVERLPGRISRTVNRLRPVHIGAAIRLPAVTAGGANALHRAVTRWPARTLNTVTAATAGTGRRLNRLLANPTGVLGGELDPGTTTRRLRNGTRQIVPTLGLQRAPMPESTDTERRTDAGGPAPRRRSWVERLMQRIL